MMFDRGTIGRALLCVFGLWSSIAEAQTPEPAFESPSESFSRAEDLYQQEDYLGAEAIYRAMLESGLDDGVIHYNLGNAYFKAGMLGRAILSYERALARMPSDEDAEANLSFANQLIADAVEPAPLPIAIAWAVRWYRSLDLWWLSLFVATGAMLAGTASAFGIVDWTERRISRAMRRLSRRVATAAAALTLISGLLLVTRIHAGSSEPQAIILAESTTVRSGPGTNNPQLAEIHEGLKVRVLSERQEWNQVSLPNGLSGWVRASDLEAI